MNRPALLAALKGVSADAVVHELTALTKPPIRHRDMRQTNRLRTVGTGNLLDAARLVGARRFVTRSIVFGYGYTDHGTHLITEDDPFGRLDSGKANPHVGAMLANERLVEEAEDIAGISLRYSLFYGGDVQSCAAMLHKRKVPIPAKGSGPLSRIHIKDAAGATVAAALYAPPPRGFPGWLIRLVAPYVGSIVLDTTMHVSNVKAKSELGWKPEYASLHQGLRAMAVKI
jgi:nucleoside-diphosphate-sugar epimerase